MMKMLYTHENPICVQNAKNMAENAGVEVVLKNQFAGGGLGELAPIETWMELWVVSSDDYLKARESISYLEMDTAISSWSCEKCGEVNEASFELCWQCQSPSSVLQES